MTIQKDYAKFILLKNLIIKMFLLGIKNLMPNNLEYTKQDIVSLLKLANSEKLEELYSLADKVRSENVGEIVHLRGIIEFSNHCCRNCMYCGIRRSNEKIHRYRLTPEQIIETAQKAHKDRYKTIILQSGEDFSFNINIISSIVKEIKQSTNMNITLSLGERSEEEYEKMKEAGADRYLLKHETSDPILYRQIHPDLKYSNRIKCLKTLKKLGFETGSGIMVGIPGQTLESLANDILLFKTLDIDMAGIGPYLSHPDTPLFQKFKSIGGYFSPATGYYDVEEMVYKVLAITRIVTKKTNLPATTALTTINNETSHDTALKRGANVIMLNVTDHKYRQYYEIYPAKVCLSENKQVTRKDIETRIKNIGRQPL